MSDIGDGGFGCGFVGGLLVGLLVPMLLFAAGGFGAAAFWATQSTSERAEEVPLAVVRGAQPAAAASPGEAVPTAAEAPAVDQPGSAGSAPASAAQPSAPAGSAPAAAPGSAGYPSAPAPAPVAPAPAPLPGVVGPQGVDQDIMATMLNNNVAIKKCFVPLFKSGAMPPRVDIRLTIQPSGSVSSVAVTNPTNLGPDFNGCMVNAVKSIGFPSWTGAAQNAAHAFIMG